MENKFSNEIIYQVMPDRYRIGKEKTIKEKIKQGLYPKGAIHKEWDELPEYHSRLNHHFFGGDLDGVREKINYMKDLGITTVYLTPVFEGETYHKYDATNYKKVDRAFGGDEALDRLIRELHKNNIKLIIDIAINHVSEKHPFFVDAVNNPESKYRDYFTFTEYPEKYQCWWGNRYLPELNLDNPKVIEEFITGETSIIRHWVNKGVDGIRLDCANDLGVPVNKIIYKTIKELKPEVTLMGEAFHFAPAFTEGLDSLQSYFYTESIYSLLNGEISSRQFGLNIQNVVERFPHEKLIQSLVILSSHDSKRVLTTLKRDEKKLFQALVLQFTLPGVPKIYYGDEIGMTGGSDPYNRAPMIWDKTRWNRKITDFYKKLIHLRKTRKEFREGKLIELSNWLDNGVIAYVRYLPESPEKYSIVIINPTEEKKQFKLFIPYDYLISELQMKDYFTESREMAKVSYMDLIMEPGEFKIYMPEPEYKENYNYYKRVSPME